MTSTSFEVLAEHPAAVAARMQPVVLPMVREDGAAVAARKRVERRSAVLPLTRADGLQPVVRQSAMGERLREVDHLRNQEEPRQLAEPLGSVGRLQREGRRRNPRVPPVLVEQPAAEEALAQLAAQLPAQLER
jgi:hypothetical protein